MPLIRVFPTDEQAEVIRTATAEAVIRFPDQAAQLRAVEAAALTQIGDGLPGPILESLVELIRRGLPSEDEADDEVWES